MKQLLILGAGTAGTTLANRLLQGRLPSDWALTVVDPAAEHLYQPGLLFLPFGARDERRMLRPRAATLRPGGHWVQQAVERIDPDRKAVVLTDGESLPYDLLVIASGSEIHPEETEGMTGEAWNRDVFEFYTLEGALRLRDALARFERGRLVVDVVEMPIKCPVAPLEFVFLADAFFRRRGLRDRVEIVYATPLDGAFTKPVAARLLGGMLESRGIRVEPSFSASAVDGDSHLLRSWDGRELAYDLLVTIPTHKGAGLIEKSGLGDELAFVPTHPHTLAARDVADTFVIGDATNLPSSKAGSVAHFQSEVLEENLLRTIAGRSPIEDFDGHANCFIESGDGKALLIDFNYEVEPLPGRFPLPGIGPLTLLGESRFNHWGKLGFRWVYWHLLLPGRPIPIPHRMSLAGKDRRLLAGASKA